MYDIKLIEKSVSAENIYRITKPQYAYIDAIRIFAICMVIALHCICDFYNDMYNSEKLSWWIMGYVNEITRTGVPLFFMISGFLLINSDTANNPFVFYKKRLAKICIPFMLYDIFYYCYYGIIDKQPISFVGFLKDLLNSGSAIHLWFIYAIIILYLFIPYIKIITEKCSLKILLFFLTLALFQPTFKPFINIILNGHATLYWSDDGIVGYMGYMILGYILGTYKLKRMIEYIIYILGGLSFIIFPLINSAIAYRTWDMVFNGGFTLNHYFEASMIFILFKNVKYRYLSASLSSLAKLCMSVYFVHIFVLERITAHVKVLPLYLYYPVLFAGTVIISFITAYCIKFVKKSIRSIYK